MPASSGPPLTERDLHLILDKKRLLQTEADLAAGFVVERVLYANGGIQGRWSLEPDADRTFMIAQAGQISVECTCQDFQTLESCQHVDGLAMAWVRSRGSFTPVNRAYTIEKFYDEFVDPVDGLALGEFFADDDLDAGEFDGGVDGLVGSPGQGPSAEFLGPPGQRLSPELRTSQADLTADYRQVFGSTNVAVMRQIARRRNIGVSGSRDVIAETLAVALGKPAVVSAAVAGLSSIARLILAVLPFALRGSRADTYSLQTLFSALNFATDSLFQAALAELNDVGLVLHTSQGYYAWPAGLTLYGGAEPRLGRRLQPSPQHRVQAAGPLDFISLATRLLFVLRSRPWPVRPPPAPPPYAMAPMTNSWPFVPEEVAALARQSATSRSMRAAVLTVPPAQPLLADDAQAEIAQLLQTDPARLDFAMQILVQVRLIHRTPEMLVGLDEPAFLQFIGQHPVQAVLPFCQAWLMGPNWLEFDLAAQRVPGLRLRRDVQFSYSLPASQLVTITFHMRASALALLQRLPAGEWMDLGAISAEAHALNAFGALWRLPQGLTLELNGRALLAQPLGDWAKSFQAWFEAMLTGPLHWQGLVDLCYDRDRLVGFRLTELGALLTLKTFAFTAPDIEQASGQPLTFEADGTLRLATSTAEPALLSLLAAVGDLQPGPAGSLVSAPSAQGALRVFQTGWDAQRLIETLEKAAGQPAPAALAKQWREWWRRLGELQIYPDLALLELGDDYAFDELMAHTSLARSLIYRFGPRLAAIRPEALDTLRAELVEKGYTPKLAAPPPAAP